MHTLNLPCRSYDIWKSKYFNARLEQIIFSYIDRGTEENKFSQTACSVWSWAYFTELIYLLKIITITKILINLNILICFYQMCEYVIVLINICYCEIYFIKIYVTWHICKLIFLY